MNPATRSAVSTLLLADPTVQSERISIGLGFIAGRDSLPSGQSAQQEFLTVAEACGLLRCSRTSLHREEKDGRIQSVRLRGRKLFERAELINALRRGTKEQNK